MRVIVTLDAEAIGKRIADARRSRSWGQRRLAEALGVRPHTVSNWERAVRTPQRDHLVALSVALRRTIGWILLGAAARQWRLPKSKRD